MKQFLVVDRENNILGLRQGKEPYVNVASREWFFPLDQNWEKYQLIRIFWFDWKKKKLLKDTLGRNLLRRFRPIEFLKYK